MKGCLNCRIAASKDSMRGKPDTLTRYEANFKLMMAASLGILA